MKEGGGIAANGRVEGGRYPAFSMSRKCAHTLPYISHTPVHLPYHRGPRIALAHNPTLPLLTCSRCACSGGRLRGLRRQRARITTPPRTTSWTRPPSHQRDTPRLRRFPHVIGTSS